MIWFKSNLNLIQGFFSPVASQTGGKTDTTPTNSVFKYLKVDLF